jgi:hypothetical protein
MKLVCYSNNTAGGLLCTLLNNTPFEMSNSYAVKGAEDNFLKISDTATVTTTIDHSAWYRQLDKISPTDKWVGTHHHPSLIPNLNDFEEVIAITTETRQSKLYRWLRYYNGWFKSVTPQWRETDDLVDIDKIRCLAKNVFEPFSTHPDCINIEFADIVDGTFIQDNLLNSHHFSLWKQHNLWLYEYNNDTWAVKRFNEAEYEIANSQPYKYI